MLKWNYVYVQQTFLKVRFGFYPYNFFKPDKLGDNKKFEIKQSLSSKSYSEKFFIGKIGYGQSDKHKEKNKNYMLGRNQPAPYDVQVVIKIKPDKNKQGSVEKNRQDVIKPKLFCAYISPSGKGRPHRSRAWYKPEKKNIFPSMISQQPLIRNNFFFSDSPP